jgi:N-acetylglucosaminyl-diphospho-decaprenol L-rhamnosyltransferase
MDLSIVVVNHHHRKMIEKNMPKIFAASNSATLEVSLIDNTRDDGAAEWVADNLTQIKLVRNSSRKSYAENMNMGMHIMKNGRYFVVLNPDIECLPGLWDEAIKFMDNNIDVGIMGPQLLNRDLTIQPSCRRFSTPLNLLIRGLHLDGILRNTRLIQEYLMLDHDHKKIMDVDWVTGALMIVRRKAIEQVGGMDECYKVAYSEDQDWCCRMWRAGWRVTYVPTARAIHDHLRTGMSKPWSKMARAQLINAIRMFHKFGWKLSRM